MQQIITCVEVKVDIKKIIKLANSKTATIQDVFTMAYQEIEKFTKDREDYYFQDFRDQYARGEIVQDSDTAGKYADQIYKSLEVDIKAFAENYADRAIDAVLDAKNENKITSKMGATNMLILLTSLKEAYK